MQRSLRLKAMVQAPKIKEYKGKVYDKGAFQMGRQVESEYSFEGNWWYIWFKGNFPLEEGDTVTLDRNYVVDSTHVFKNYKRGTVLLS